MILKYFDLFVLVLIGIMAISDINCKQEETEFNSDNLKTLDEISIVCLLFYKSVFFQLKINLNFCTIDSFGEHRFKRRLQDVEKLMINDDFMALLICDLCEKNDCEPEYCSFCKACVVDQQKSKFITHH